MISRTDRAEPRAQRRSDGTEIRRCHAPEVAGLGRRLSGSSMAGPPASLCACCSDRFLAKPVSVTDMVRTVRELMATGLCRQSG